MLHGESILTVLDSTGSVQPLVSLKNQGRGWPHASGNMPSRARPFSWRAVDRIPPFSTEAVTGSPPPFLHTLQRGSYGSLPMSILRSWVRGMSLYQRQLARHAFVFQLDLAPPGFEAEPGIYPWKLKNTERDFVALMLFLKGHRKEEEDHVCTGIGWSCLQF